VSAGSGDYEFEQHRCALFTHSMLSHRTRRWELRDLLVQRVPRSGPAHRECGGPVSHTCGDIRWAPMAASSSSLLRASVFGAGV
jgi:hypothetical protein